MVATVEDNSYGIGYLDAGHGHDFGLSEAETTLGLWVLGRSRGPAKHRDQVKRDEGEIRMRNDTPDS